MSKEILELLEEKRERARLGGGQARIDKQHAKGQIERARTHSASA